MTSLTNGINTMKKVRKLVKVVREIDEFEKNKIGFSSVIYRKDKDHEEERNEVNMKLKKYCGDKGFVFIGNANINESGMNNSKLHLNKERTNVLTQNIKRSFNQFWSYEHTHEVDITNFNLFENNETDQVLKVLMTDNPSKLNFCYLNINSVRNKFTELQTIINGNVDTVSTAETKLDAIFSSAQFTLEWYHTSYCLDISNKSGGIFLYIKSSISSRRLSFEELRISLQAIHFEINWRKEKWLVMSIYCPPSLNSEYFLNVLTKIIDYFASTYDNHLILVLKAKVFA